MGEPQLRLEQPEATATPLGAVTAAAAVGFRGVVMGYNHQIPHQGRVYHVQTEDSGSAKRHISTHVFYSGTIIASKRVDYSEARAKTDIVELLKKSHKAMMIQLVRGFLDEAIVRCLGSKSERPKRLVEAKRPALRAVPTPVEDSDSGEATAIDAVDPPGARLEQLLNSLDLGNIKQVLGDLAGGVIGTLGVALVDYESGVCLGTAGAGIDLDVAAAGNMKVMKAKIELMRALGIEDGLEDVLITLDSQYHILRPLDSALFLYLAIDRSEGNLALARHKLCAAADDIRA